MSTESIDVYDCRWQTLGEATAHVFKHLLKFKENNTRRQAEVPLSHGANTNIFSAAHARADLYVISAASE
jgi:hypothetical protein